MIYQLDETPSATPPNPDRLELAEWRERFGVVAGITTAVGGNDYRLGPDPLTDEALRHWQKFFEAMRPAFHRFRLARQVHGNRVLRHRGAEGAEAPGPFVIADAADGHLTDELGTLLLVTAADCVPVYLLDPEHRAVALVHAGWRGTAAGIVERGIEELTTLTGASAEDVVMHCGVSICGSCYEVGPDVIAAVHGSADDGQHAHLDLRREIARRAGREGVREISLSGWCAAHDHDRFYSHRRSHGQDGRMVAYVGFPAP